MTITIHPLRFARRPCLRGTVSYCLLCNTRWHHAMWCHLYFIYSLKGCPQCPQSSVRFSSYIILTLMNITRNDMFNIKRRLSPLWRWNLAPVAVGERKGAFCKVNKKRAVLLRLLFLGGAWRIRTAVDGFADRRLSHSSKAPCSLFASAKVWHFCESSKYFPKKSTIIAQFIPFLPLLAEQTGAMQTFHR